MSKGRATATTLRDVAARAGVNTTTASVVLNNTRSGTRVSEATRTRILAVAEEMGYRPNAAARGMKHRRMNTIGVVDRMVGGELNLYFLEVLNGILEEAARHEQNTTVFSVSDWSKDESKILKFSDGRVDGFIFIGPQFHADFAERLQQYTPFVALHSNEPLAVATSLEVDDEQGGYFATRHLIDLGHRHIFHFAAPLDLVGPQKRLAGFRRAMEEAGLPSDDSLVLPGQFSLASGFERMAELLANRQSRPLPTAIFCASDAIASGCLEALSQSGLRAPDDISVVGFDDSLAARMTTPPLTTIRQPFRTLGQRAVELLLQRITNEASADPEGPHPEYQDEVFPVELVVRGSTAPPLYA